MIAALPLAAMAMQFCPAKMHPISQFPLD